MDMIGLFWLWRNQKSGFVAQNPVSPATLSAEKYE